MVPVMVMGTFIGGKQYSSLEYLCAALIAAGISLFANQSSSKVVRKLAEPNAPWGYTLCLLNLIFDGYTNAKQVPPTLIHIRTFFHMPCVHGAASSACYLPLLCAGKTCAGEN
jgi:drug/metabolite transporter (DMT)-like permease